MTPPKQQQEKRQLEELRASQKKVPTINMEVIRRGIETNGAGNLFKDNSV